jgi:hypothetical protein
MGARTSTPRDKRPQSAIGLPGDVAIQTLAITPLPASAERDEQAVAVAQVRRERLLEFDPD